jgi:AhpC/TSA family
MSDHNGQRPRQGPSPSLESGAASAQEPLILPGDRIPEFILPDPQVQLRNFYDVVSGRPTVLVLAANTARQDQWDEIKGYADAQPLLAERDVDLIIVSNDGVESLAMVSKAIPAPAIWLADVKGAVNLALRRGASFELSGIVSFVLDSNQRVLALKGPGAGHGPWALSVVRTLSSEAPQILAGVAPVLILPRVLEEQICRRLLAELSAGAPADTPVPIRDATLAATVSRQMLRRVGPEVDKVFSFDDFNFEALALRYEDAATPEGRPGDLRREAADLEKGRSFHLLLDLDAEAYRGGGVRFPEYGAHVYRPGTGGALVYAGGLMRELRAIEAGRRALLSLTLRRPAKPKTTPEPKK